MYLLPASYWVSSLSPTLTRFQASIAVLYVIVSYILYYDSLLPLLIAVGSDFAMLIAFIVVAVTSGKNLNMLECSALPPPPSKQSSEPVTFTVSAPPSEQTSSVNSNINTSPSPITDGGAGGSGGYSTTSYGNPGDGSGSGGGNYGSSVVYNIGRVVARAASESSNKKPTVDYLSFVARDQPHCYEIKTVWGLGIALCVLFAFSSIVCAGLWRRVKGPGSSAADKDLEG